jgi:hypothetical protein
MKRVPGKRPRRTQPPPTPEQIRGYIHALVEEHQEAWHKELLSPAPRWTCMLALHLRTIELEHLESAAGQFL